jgi:DNA transformation protein and related proteins
MAKTSFAEKSALTDLPNIGPEVARLLTAAGITTPAQLKKLGSVEAARRIAKMRPTDPPCRSMLAGLEGAIRGLRWHAIPKPDREALWEEYQARIN